MPDWLSGFLTSTFFGSGFFGAGAAVSFGAGGGHVIAPSLTTVAPRTTSSSMSTTSTPSFFGHMSVSRCRRFVA